MHSVCDSSKSDFLQIHNLIEFVRLPICGVKKSV